jgi:hypothetical protein
VGALRGIGETFAPDLHTGTGNLTVPLSLPPGRNGLQPQLSLAYSTGGGNGAFGLGWSLSVPGVVRKTAKGVPVYNEMASDELLRTRGERRDVFVLSGSEDLVPVAGAYPGVVHYRPRSETLFALIERHRDPDPGHDVHQGRVGQHLRHPRRRREGPGGGVRPRGAPPRVRVAVDRHRRPLRHNRRGGKCRYGVAKGKPGRRFHALYA